MQHTQRNLCAIVASYQMSLNKAPRGNKSWLAGVISVMQKCRNATHTHTRARAPTDTHTHPHTNKLIKRNTLDTCKDIHWTSGIMAFTRFKKARVGFGIVFCVVFCVLSFDMFFVLVCVEGFDVGGFENIRLSSG